MSKVFNMVGGGGGPYASIFVTGLSETDTVTAVHKKTVQVPNPAAHGLPDGYTELEYIESSGTQYIDIGVYPTSGDEFSVTFKFDSVPTSNHTIFGVSNNVRVKPVICLDTFTYPAFRFGTSSGWIDSVQDATTEKTTASLSGSTLSIGNSSYDASQIGTTSNYSLKLFAWHGDTGINNYGSFKLYGFEWIRASNTVRKMIPAKRNSDSVIGLYDLVNDVFYTNAGTGTFTAGSEIPAYIEMTVDDKTLAGKWTQKPNPAYVVPDGYTQLEYIESTGTQYIDTGISANSTNLTVECDGTSLGTGFSLFGVGGTYSFEVLPAPDKSFTRFNYYASTIDISGGPYDGVFKMDRNKCYINGSLVHTFSSASWSVDNIWLFGRNRYGALDNSGASTIRYCKIWVADELVRHFIPCKNGEGTFGLYDLVNDVFYTNSGTGTFTAGAEVPQTISYFLIKPIRDFGTWTVTATEGTNTATQDVLVDVITEYEIEMGYKLWLYRDGDECEATTGGWSADGYTRKSYTVKAGTKESDCLNVKGTGTLTSTILGTANAIDFSGYSNLCVEYQIETNDEWNPALMASTTKAWTATTAYSKTLSDLNSRLIAKIDISGTTESYFVVWHADALNANIRAYRIWLE